MITNTVARDALITRIEGAKPAVPGKRHNSRVVTSFATTSAKAGWLARGERAVGLVGGMKDIIILSPAGARAPKQSEMILIYGPAGGIVHEEAATPAAVEIFNNLFARH